jgi:hypothetical protein
MYLMFLMSKISLPSNPVNLVNPVKKFSYASRGGKMEARCLMKPSTKWVL